MSRAILNLLAAVTTFSFAGCGQGGTDATPGTTVEAPPLTATTLGPQTILSSRDYLAQDSYASADMARGEALSMQCRACHTLEKGGANVLGPNLYGLFGRTAGSAPGFPYSDALAAGGFVWTPRALAAWLAQPFTFLPGNRMSFPGLRDENDRNALIAYLLRYTDAGTGGST